MTEVDESKKVPELGESPVVEQASHATAKAGESEGGELNAEGRERPRFLLEFPDHPELNALVRAFELGNYQAVRVGAPTLQSSDDPAVREAARELRRRIDPDPLTKYLLGIALSLFVFLVWYTYQSHLR